MKSLEIYEKFREFLSKLAWRKTLFNSTFLMRITLQILELDAHLYFQNDECYSSIIIVWANFTLGSNSVKGKARPNILYE